MNKLDEKLRQLSQKLERLIDKLNELKQHNQTLIKQNQSLKTDLKTKDKKIQSLEERLKVLNIAKRGEVDEEERKAMKRSINQYIREIDRCIRQLAD